MLKLGWMLVMCAACEFPRPQNIGPDDGGVHGGDAPPQGEDCQLTAIDTELAITGHQLLLEGTFRGEVTVNFPGAISAVATVLGEHRARVLVPSTATAGALTVTACNATFGPLMFRRASFATGLGRFESSFDQASGARQTPKLLIARHGHTIAMAGSRLYVVGGASTGGLLDVVEQSSVNADGSLGAFQESSSKLVTPRTGHTSVVIGKYLYVVGGFGERALDSVERAVINLDGSLGPFEVLSQVTLATARHQHTSVVIGNNLYLLGGIASGPLDSVERAVIRADGSIGPFAIVGDVRLLAGRQAPGLARVGDSLYVVGGVGSSGTRGDLERAPISPDGSLGPFVSVANVVMSSPRSGLAIVTMEDAMYVVGGRNAADAIPTVERVAIDADGVLGTFSTVPGALTTAREGHALVRAENYLYAIGGAGAGGALLGTIERAPLNTSGVLDMPVASPGVAFAVERSESTIVAIERYLYAIGGAAVNAGTVERAKVAADGALGAFESVPGVAQRTPRKRHAAAVIGSHVYVVGGQGAGGVVKTIERAPIEAGGSLGAFVDVYALTTARQNHTCAVIGDYLYVIGGDDGVRLLTSIERAVIKADGSLEPFAIVATSRLGSGRQGHKTIVLGNSLYVLGGDTDVVERAFIGTDGSLGPLQAIAGNTLRNGDRFQATATPVADRLYVLGGESGSLGQGRSEQARIGDGPLGSFSLEPSAVLLRSGHAAVVAGNYLHVIGGVDGVGAPSVPPALSSLLK